MDASKTFNERAKENARLSLQDSDSASRCRIRFLQDDVMKFMERELRRGKGFDGLVLDPSSYGRSRCGTWKCTRDLPELLRRASELLMLRSSSRCQFFVISAHTPKFTAEHLMDMVSTAMHPKFLQPEHYRHSHRRDLTVSSFGPDIDHRHRHRHGNGVERLTETCDSFVEYGDLILQSASASASASSSRRALHSGVYCKVFIKRCDDDDRS